MKKILFALSILVLCAAAFAVEATVVSVKGRVEMRDGNTWIALQANDKIEKGAVISTGYNSQAVLEFKGTKLTLAALTRATVEDLLEESDKDSASLFIDSGKVSANVNGADGKRVGFKVRSPIATASVRGTSFSFTAAGDLSVDRGLVSLSPANYEGEKGVPVAAEQNSKIDDTTGVVANPATEKSLTSIGGLNSTTPLSASEAVATTTTSVTTNNSSSEMFSVSYSNSDASSSFTTPTTSTTDVGISINFPTITPSKPTDNTATGNLNVNVDFE